MADARPSYPELPAIGVAAEALCAALERALGEYEKRAGYSNGHEICWAMGGFVAQLRRVPAFWAELERRACLVGQKTAQGTAYARAKTRAPTQCTERSSETEQPCLVEEPGVQETIPEPRPEREAESDCVQGHLLAQIAEERANLERLLEHNLFDGTGAEIEALSQWKDECDKILADVGRTGLETDGCWHLVHVYGAVYGQVPDDRRDVAAWAKNAVTDGRLGREVLEGIRRAAEGLVEWSSKLGSSRSDDQVKSRTRDARLWYFTENPPADSKFEFGTLEGTLKELARWLHLDQRVLKEENGTRWWIAKVHGKRWRIWFPNEHAYARAGARRAAESNRA